MFCKWLWEYQGSNYLGPFALNVGFIKVFMNVNCKISSSRRIKLLFKTLLFAEPWQIWSVEFSITSFPQYKDTSRQNLNVSTKLHPHVYHTMLQEIDEDGNLFLLTVISATIFKTIMSKGNRRLPLYYPPNEQHTLHL